MWSQKEEDADRPASPGLLDQPGTPPEGQFAGQSAVKVSGQYCVSNRDTRLPA